MAKPGLDRLERVEVGQAPRLGAVGQVAVGEHDHRRAVLHGQPDGLDGDGEAVARRLGRQDRQGRLAVAAVHGVQQVGLLGLGRQPGGRPAALDVDDDERQLEVDGQADRLGLEVQARAAGRGDAEGTAEGRAEGGADAGDLVLGLEGADAELLAPAQLVEDVRGRA